MPAKGPAPDVALAAANHLQEGWHRRLLVRHDPRHVRVVAHQPEQCLGLGEIFQEVDVQHFLAHGAGQVDREAEHQVCQRQLLTRHIGCEAAVALERGKPGQQVGPRPFLDQRLHRHAKERLGVAGTRRQLDVQFDFLEQLAHLGLPERVGRQQRLAALGLLDIVEDHTGFAEEAMFGLQHRHLAPRAHFQRLRRLAAIEGDFLERQAFFQQGQLDHVVVVADRESMKLEHEVTASRP